MLDYRVEESKDFLLVAEVLNEKLQLVSVIEGSAWTSSQINL